ncbi:Glycine-tRNA ligase [Parasponia andersonii]|uniref:glycine--tRNA ligase n=1 Tax=Parasponia andersonii TaxID=3476 RepID=A0A2P5CCM3_PARAD|nr:Glycine-tRNA ligase [Parasponia andersonii]
MAILGFPLVISFLKPQASCLSLHLYAARTSPTRFRTTLDACRRQFARTSVSAISTSAAAAEAPQHSSKDSNTEVATKPSVLTFQQAIQRLQEYWASVGCAIMQCSNTEVGAGTMNPLTFLRVLGPEAWNVAYVEPSIRPDDSRYGENPNRLQRHTQFQVILKPDPGNSQDLFIGSLSALGIDVQAHDIRFVEDNWESPVLGAWGLGWEIWMDGMEITQFTYFQQAGSLQLSPISVEITYGLERILMLLQGVDHFKKIQYADGITYGELFMENEKEMSAYYLEHANVEHLQKHFDFFEEESRSLLASGLAIPAYDQLLKTSHTFNILDSRGFVGVTERARYFGRMRSLARQCAQLWLKTRESLGHPLGVVSEPVNLVCPKELLEAAVRRVGDNSRLFVLEIGTEEIPPQDVVVASQQLKDLTLQLLDKQRLSHGEVQAFGTPRRLVVFVEDLCTRQEENEVEVRGPPASKAFDDQGNPTKAGEGFCRRYSVPLDSLYRKVDGKIEYLYARIKESSRLALEVLSEDLPSAIAKISFPKSMRWNSQVLFSRPIRWILALYGDVVVPFTFAGILSGNKSFGLRNSRSATFMVETAESYADQMRNAGINIEVEKRKKTILEHSNALAKSVKGNVVVKDGLLNEVANLVEAPVPVLGEFKESFLDLPNDLLTMVMQKHQKYFALTDENGRLLPYFIAVANGVIDEKVVKKGNEAVLRARYEDAKFFYEMDTRKRFSEFRSQLKGILFHEKLGTMLDKMMRVQIMASKLSLALRIDDSMHQIVNDAASLAMSDLATAVVTEFTSLSGIMARHYALRDGYSEQIAEALFEITLPRFSGDLLPKTDVGIVLSIADRLDSLVGLFASGCQPSSTNDPFGLRRISYGLVQVLVEKDKDLDLKAALQLAADAQSFKVEASTVENVDKGTSSEVVHSILIERANIPSLAAKSAYKMDTLSKGKLFPKVIEAYSRPTRIVRGKDIDPNIEVDEAIFETKEEKALWSAFLSVKSKIYRGVEVDDFIDASSQLLQPLEDFFDNVFVMVEDERIRKNRLALLKKIADLPKGIADLSVLPGF